MKNVGRERRKRKDEGPLDQDPELGTNQKQGRLGHVISV